MVRGGRVLAALAATVISAPVIPGCTGASTGEDSAIEGCSADDLTLDVGTGADMYVPLADGDHVTLVHGPQGGWHVEAAGFVHNTEDDEVSISPTITVPDLGGMSIA